MNKQLEDANNQIEELKQLVNDAAGAEDMIEKLTEQNLDLNEVGIIFITTIKKIKG